MVLGEGAGHDHSGYCCLFILVFLFHCYQMGMSWSIASVNCIELRLNIEDSEESECSKSYKGAAYYPRLSHHLHDTG